MDFKGQLNTIKKRGEEDMVDRSSGGKTTSGNGQAWSLPTQKAVESREKWRKLVVKSSVVLQYPSWFRDRSRHEGRTIQYCMARVILLVLQLNTYTVHC